MSCCYVSYLCLLLDIASNYFTVAFFHCQSCAFRTSKPHYCQHTGFRGFLWVGSSCWEEVTLFHCKSCAFIRSKPRQCQTHWFQRFFCALGHHVGKRWLSFIARAVLSLGRSHAIAKHTGFRGFLWVGSSCWEEVALFHCKSCAFSRSKPHYCQTHWFQRFFCGLAHHVGKRWLSFIARAVLSLGRSRAIAKHIGLAHHVGKRWLTLCHSLMGFWWFTI